MFHSHTVRELKNRIDGFEELQKEKYQEYMYGVRKICYHSVNAIAGKKGFKKESNVFPLDIDKVITRQKIKSGKLKPVVITRKSINDGK